MSKNKGVRFTLIDALVALAIIAVLAFVGYSFIKKSPADTTSVTEKGEKYIMTFYVEEVPEFAAQKVEKGDKATDDVKSIPLGKIIDLKVDEAVVYNTDYQGNTVKSAKEGYNSMMITTEVEANEFEHGLSIWGQPYVVGTTMTMYMGEAKVYGRVYNIEKKDTKAVK